ncbi:hypothetical protein GCM10027030_02350 [Luteococcus sediminum]
MASERVERRQAATRQRIVEAAMGLFLSQGFEQTSVAQISEAADIGKGTFFTYFATKQAVLSFLGEQVMAAMAAADHPTQPAPARLRSVFAAAGGWFDAHEAAARQMCVARITTFGQADVSSSQPALVELLSAIIVDGMASGEFRQVDRRAAALMLVSAYVAPVVQWTWSAPGTTLTPSLLAQLDLALAALAA